MANMEEAAKPTRHAQKTPEKPAFRHRLSDSQTVLQIWKCVNTIRHQRQKPTPDRLTKFIAREMELEESEANKMVENLLHDGMLLCRESSHKQNKGLMEEAFSIPSREEVIALHGSHDWYCFECHKPGEDLYLCETCWRSFHVTCVNRNPESNEPFTCKICLAEPTIGVRELNRLLGYTISRLKERTRELFHVLRGPEHEELVELFVHKQMDLGKMNEKVRRRLYRTLEEFKADAQLVLHDIVLVFGENQDENQLAALANIMLKDCIYDVEEIRLCKDCYYLSNKRPKDWFTEPCKRPHELVYAKQRGYSYWPAKIIKKTGTGYDVRFFGRGHQRATVKKEFVQAVDIANVQKLVPKRTAGFTSACQELKLHQEKLERHNEMLLARKEQGLPSDDEDADIPSEAEEEEEETMEEEVAPEGVDDRDVSTVFESTEEVNPEEGAAAVQESDNEAAAIPPSKKAKKDKDLNAQSDDELVTSSDDHRPVVVPSPSKTPKSKMLPPTGRKRGRPAGTPSTPGTCNCKEEHKKEIAQLKKELKEKYAAEKSKALKEQAARMRKDFEQDKQQAVSRAMANVTREVDKAKRKVEDTLKPEYLEEMKKLAQKHHELISLTKKKQWCYNCEQEAMYHCCWNTSYCSTKCQQEHWHREHKRVCRRKR